MSRFQHRWGPALAFTLGTGAALSMVLWKIFQWVEMMPLAASEEAHKLDHAFNGMLILTIPLYGLLVGALLAPVFFFREGRDRGEGVRLDRSPGYWVEAAWIGVSILLTAGLAAFGVQEFKSIRGTDRADLDIQVTASQFTWEFFYPATNTQSTKLILPKGKRARLLITSKDVVHSFWVPEFRLKQDAVPGKVVKLLFTPTVAGSYTLLCAELCGMEHTEMKAHVEVVEPEAFGGAVGEENW